MDEVTFLGRIMRDREIGNAMLARACGAQRQDIYKLRRGIIRMLPNWAKRLAPHLGEPKIEWKDLIDGPDDKDAGLAKVIAAYMNTTDEGREFLESAARQVRPADTPSDP